MVKGNPLQLVSTSLGINVKSEIPSIRWGQSNTCGAIERTNQRVLKIFNGSPAGFFWIIWVLIFSDIRIKWTVLRWEAEPKLVDLSFQEEEGRGLKLVF